MKTWILILTIGTYDGGHIETVAFENDKECLYAAHMYNKYHSTTTGRVYATAICVPKTKEQK